MVTRSSSQLDTVQDRDHTPVRSLPLHSQTEAYVSKQPQDAYNLFDTDAQNFENGTYKSGDAVQHSDADEDEQLADEDEHPDKDEEDADHELLDDDYPEQLADDMPQDARNGSFEEDFDDQAYQYAKRVLPSDEDTSGEDEGMDLEVSGALSYLLHISFDEGFRGGMCALYG